VATRFLADHRWILQQIFSSDPLFPNAEESCASHSWLQPERLAGN